MSRCAEGPQARIIGEELPRMPLRDLIGWKVTGLRNRVSDLCWERRLGINTRGSVLIHQPDAHFYGTFAYRSIFRILRRLRIGPKDVFIDIGCGKGRVVCCAATHPAARAIGVDLDASLCRQAQANAERLRFRRAPIQIINAPAQEIDYDLCTKFFLFHPFGASTLRQVVALIRDSVARRPRTIEMAYTNPVHDDVLEQAGGFERFDRWHWHPWSGLKHDVSYWRLAQRTRLSQIRSQQSEGSVRGRFSRRRDSDRRR